MYRDTMSSIKMENKRVKHLSSAPMKIYEHSLRFLKDASRAE